MNPRALDILYVITDLEFGGVPLHLYRLACAMRDRGFRSSVVCLAPAGPVADLLREVGIDVRSCNGRGGFDYGVIGRLACIIKDTQPLRGGVG